MLRLIPALVLVLILILFALSNRQEVTLGFWPTDYTTQLPLAVAVLVGMALAFLLGAAMVWVGKLSIGRRARRAEASVRRLQAQLAAAEASQAAPSHFSGAAGTSGALAGLRRPEPVLPPPES